MNRDKGDVKEGIVQISGGRVCQEGAADEERPMDTQYLLAVFHLGNCYLEKPRKELTVWHI